MSLYNATTGSSRVGFRVKTHQVEHYAAAVIFDLDGVLVDSHSQIDEALRVWAADLGVDLTDWWDEAHSLTDPEFIALVAPASDVDAETRALRSIEYELAATTHAFPGARRIYEAVPPSMRCIVTSGSRDIVRERLRAAHLPEPAVLVTADDVVQGKPHPEPYLSAIEQLRVQAGSVLVIEDSATGARAARKAGASVVGVAATHSARRLLHAEGVTDCVSALTAVHVEEISPSEMCAG